MRDGSTASGFAVVSRLTLQEQVYQALRNRLMVGGMTAGQSLTVRELAQQMGTSPMPVREAMRRLIAERALELLPNGTVRVRLMSDAQRAESREIRALLEGMAVARAASRIGAPEIAEGHRLNATMRQAIAENRLDDYILDNQRFHFLCYRAAGSETLFEIIESLWVQTGPFLRLYVLDTLANRQDQMEQDFYTNHDDILAAFERRDAEAAARALTTDIRRTAATHELEVPDYIGLAFDALKGSKPAQGGGKRRRPPVAAAPAVDDAELAGANGHRQTLQEQVYRRLHRILITGEVVPGQVVTVRSFAEEFGTSPMPVREALRRLVAEGAFEPLPNGSLRVRMMSPTQREHSREIRALLEGVAVARAAERISPAELAAAVRSNEAMKSAVAQGDLKAASVANLEFHFVLYRAAQSEILTAIIERLWLQNGPFLMLHLLDYGGRPRAQRRELFAQHAIILDALARRDAAAAAAALVADLMQTQIALEEQTLLRLDELRTLTRSA
jgi:DNA-binding GntR family transcriptional regulator